MKLFQVLNNEVTIIKENQLYNDTIENYILDGGYLQINNEKIISVVYDDRQNYCEINEKATQYPIDFFENIINNVDIFLVKKEKREIANLSLDEAKEAKIQQVKSWIEDKIEEGFISSASGSIIKYDTDKDIQLSVLSIIAFINTTLFTERYQNGYPLYGYKPEYIDQKGNITWSRNKTLHTLSTQQISIWSADLSAHINNYKQKEQEKIIEIEKCKTKKDLESIILK